MGGPSILPKPRGAAGSPGPGLAVLGFGEVCGRRRPLDPPGTRGGGALAWLPRGSGNSSASGHLRSSRDCEAERAAPALAWLSWGSGKFAGVGGPSILPEPRGAAGSPALAWLSWGWGKSAGVGGPSILPEPRGAAGSPGSGLAASGFGEVCGRRGPLDPPETARRSRLGLVAARVSGPPPASSPSTPSRARVRSGFDQGINR